MDETTQHMLESEQSLDQIKDWSTAQKEDIKLFREARTFRGPKRALVKVLNERKKKNYSERSRTSKNSTKKT